MQVCFLHCLMQCYIQCFIPCSLTLFPLLLTVGKGIDKAVTKVFRNGVEHRECMRRLVQNFQKRFRGEVFERNLWPASRCYRQTTHDRHWNEMLKACPKATTWLLENHKQLWVRSKFSTTSRRRQLQRSLHLLIKLCSKWSISWHYFSVSLKAWLV